LPKLYFAKYPKDTANKYAIICDPMLASAGSVIMGKLYECVTVHWSLRSLYVAKSWQSNYCVSAIGLSPLFDASIFPKAYHVLVIFFGHENWPCFTLFSVWYCELARQMRKN